MSFKSISVVVTDEATDGPALKAACEMAFREDAHLEVHCIGIDPARYDAMPAGTALAVLEYGAAEARAQADALRKWVVDLLPADMAKVSVEAVVVPQMGLESQVSRLVRYSDLLIATKPYGTGRSPLQVSVLEAELFGTASPVLVVPQDGDGANGPFERVVCAWNESSESFNAIRLALPILKAARKVDIVMVEPPTHSPERSDPGGAITLMLARHGVRGEVSILARTMPRVFDVLDRFAEDRSADLLVMGAYGHSRFREAILGGVTRESLEQSRRPLLLAH